MVKVQTPNSKTFKKSVSVKRKTIQKKKSGVKSKEKVKVIGEKLKNDAKDIKLKSGDLIKKTKKLPQKDQASIKKKGPIKNEENRGQKVLIKNVTTKNAVAKNLKPKNEVLNKESVKVSQKKLKTIPNKHPAASNTQNKSQHEARVTEKKKKIKNKEDKAKTITSSPVFEPSSFDEDKFKDIVKLENIKKICDALKILVEKQVSEKKTSIFSDYRYFLNIAMYKIPNCPKRMVKLNVKHSLVDINTDDVVIIVPDLQRGAKVDYEPTIQHYEDLLSENGLENIKVVPFNQLRNEFTTFEAKIKFANTYDYFLCDGRIVGQTAAFCGHHFQKPRTTIHAVRLGDPKTIKNDIERSLKRTSFKQLHKGDLISIPVGNHRFTTNQLAENIEVVIDQLETLLPGSYANIRNIHIKIDIKGTSALPLYINLLGGPQETPNVIGPREQRMLKLKKEANDILSKFSMSKAGEFVKLNKTQVKRKQQLQNARRVLLSKENVDDDNDSEFKPILKKVKKVRKFQGKVK